MKLLPNKTFPHPVLSKDADDYKKCQFQATRDFSLASGGRPVLSVKFVLSEKCIQSMIKKEEASYIIEVTCQHTHIRRIFQTFESSIECKFKAGEIYERVEVNAFIVCLKKISRFRSPNMHKEFGESKFYLEPGDVLAAEQTQEWWWDVELLAPLHSVVELVVSHSVLRGRFEVDTEGDKIKIQMHKEDKDKFEHIRKSKEQKYYAMLLYCTAVAEAIRQMAELEEGERDKKWCRSIEYKLTEKNKSLDSCLEEPMQTAQELLGNPLKLSPSPQ